MSKFKITFDFTRDDKPAPVQAPGPSPTDLVEKAWPILVEARRNNIRALEDGDADTVEQINHWIGGALSMLSNVSGVSAVDLVARLNDEIPYIPKHDPRQFKHVERRERPSPPPGAPRPVDVTTLTQEERDQLGIVLPDSAQEPSDSV